MRYRYGMTSVLVDYLRHVLVNSLKKSAHQVIDGIAFFKGLRNSRTDTFHRHLFLLSSSKLLDRPLAP